MPRPGVTVTRPPAPAARPSASIVIVAYGQRAMTEMCLAALERALGDRLGREFDLFHHQAGDLPYTACPLELDVVTAALMALPRAVYDELGGFDEAFLNGWEDTDLCLRARVAGHRVVYRGDLVAVHHEGASRGRS